MNTTFTTSSSTPSGTYTLFLKADGHNGGYISNGSYVGGTITDNGYLTESNEANNIVALPVSLNADLALSNVSIGTMTANSNGTYTIPVSYTVTNQGSVTANPNWYDLAYLSADGVLDNTDQVLSGNNIRTTALAPGVSYTLTINYTTSNSTPSGTYTLFLKTDGRNGGYASTGTYIGGVITDNGFLTESNEANNIVALPVSLNADLALSNVSIGTMTANSNGTYTIPVSYTVTNQGSVTANPNWYDLAYLSADGVLDNTDQVLSGNNIRTTALAPGVSYTLTINYTTSNSTPSGTYTLFLKTDGRNGGYASTGTYIGGVITDNGFLTESNEANNISSTPVTLQ